MRGKPRSLMLAAMKWPKATGRFSKLFLNLLELKCRRMEQRAFVAKFVIYYNPQ